MFVLKLPPFFTRRNGEGKRAAISKLMFIWTTSSCSYIAFALAASRVACPRRAVRDIS